MVGQRKTTQIPWQKLIVWNNGGSPDKIGRAPIGSLADVIERGSHRYVPHLGGIEVKGGNLVSWKGFEVAPPGEAPNEGSPDSPSVDWSGFAADLAKHRKTGYVTAKRYQCASCGGITTESTNHYGDIYPRCPHCGWKHPMEAGQVLKCLEPVPEGWGTPTPWKTVRLGDIAQVVTGKAKRSRRPRLTR
jgi:DNA-directed RNA polymerase subunit RPC12/RpoP